MLFLKSQLKEQKQQIKQIMLKPISSKFQLHNIKLKLNAKGAKDQ
jgi:hypothetical protein